LTAYLEKTAGVQLICYETYKYEQDSYKNYVHMNQRGYKTIHVASDKLSWICYGRNKLLRWH